MTLDEWRAFYAGLGLVTIPLRPREKRPLRKGWRDGREEQWSGVPADANVGVLTGSISGGLVVLDFDTEDGPFELLGFRPRELASRTLVVRTARGWHVYARAVGVPTSSPRQGVDVRADGALVVAPPSVHPSGVRYALQDGARSIADLASFADPAVLEPQAVAADLEISGIDMEHVEDWIAAQWPALRAAWARLRRPAVGASFDASRADFAVARCLWEGGYSPSDVARVLMSLPGSRARERGERYALQTAMRARGDR